MHTAPLGSAGNCLHLWLLASRLSVFNLSEYPTRLSSISLALPIQMPLKRRRLSPAQPRPARGISHAIPSPEIHLSFWTSSYSGPADSTVSRPIRVLRTPDGYLCVKYAMAVACLFFTSSAHWFAGYIPIVFPC